nr:Ig-like domain-containing protein [Shewanella sp. YLB-07]
MASVGGNVPPSVTQTSPTADSQITVGDITLLTADAADSDGAITQVDFYLDDALLATVASAPFEHSWTATEGLHSFKVKATDNDGAQTFSSSVQVNKRYGCPDFSYYCLPRRTMIE